MIISVKFLETDLTSKPYTWFERRRTTGLFDGNGLFLIWMYYHGSRSSPDFDTHRETWGMGVESGKGL